MASAEASADDHQRAVLERQLHGLPNDAEQPNSQPNSKPNIIIYATRLDKVILSLSSICAIIAGALNPLVPVCSINNFLRITVINNSTTY